MGDNILIIGGAGFIGSYLANELSKDNNVTVVDNLINGDFNRLNDNIKTSRRTKIEHLDNADYIYYLACSQISISDNEPHIDLYSNAKQFLKIVEFFRLEPSKRLKKIVYTSSCSVYGNNYNATEETPVEINSIYAATKYLGENYANLYYKNYGIPINIVRYSNVYGYNQTPEYTCGVIGKFIYNAANGKELTVIDAEATRDYTFIEDAVEATKLIAYNAPAGETYNISTNKATSIREIITEIKKHFNVVIHDLPKRIIDNIKHRKISYEKLSKLGWRPKHNLKEGIQKIIEREYSSSNK